VSNAPLIELNNVDVCLEGERILRNVSWQLMPGENWAVVGSNGAGKSTFLRLIRGDLWPVPAKGKRIYHLDDRPQRTAVGIKEQLPLVSPEAQDRYLQLDWKRRVDEVIYSGLAGTDYVYRQPSPEQRDIVSRLVETFGIVHLLKRDVQELSTGELRRVLIARALVRRPRVLLLDEVCDGLDAQGRRGLLGLLNQIALNGTQLIYTTHRGEEMIPAITHVLVLKSGRMSSRGAPKRLSQPGARPPRVRLKKTGALSSKPLICIDRADVYLQRKRVLQDIMWSMDDGQNWAVFGCNGSGKSTLLKLICGDIHPAAGCRVRRFDFTARNTLWEIRERIGFIAPGLQAVYREPLNGAQVIASGFFSSVGLLDRVTSKQSRRVKDLLRAFGLSRLANIPTAKMSYGEFRKVLLLRALVHDPKILVCDEPFDGLDDHARRIFRETLDRLARNGTRLVTVTHHVDDLPQSITHALVLEKGRIVCQGELGKIKEHPALRRLFAHE
jgi:molybdate transport system ATP-binding protein